MLWLLTLLSPAFGAPLNGVLIGGGASAGVFVYPGADGLGTAVGPGLDLALGLTAGGDKAGVRFGTQVTGAGFVNDEDTFYAVEWQALQLGAIWSAEGSVYQSLTVGGGLSWDTQLSGGGGLVRADYGLGLKLFEYAAVEIGPYGALHIWDQATGQVGLKLHVLGFLPFARERSSYQPVARNGASGPKRQPTRRQTDDRRPLSERRPTGGNKRGGELVDGRRDGGAKAPSRSGRGAPDDPLTRRGDGKKAGPGKAAPTKRKTPQPGASPKRRPGAEDDEITGKQPPPRRRGTKRKRARPEDGTPPKKRGKKRKKKRKKGPKDAPG